jgi:fatty acid kinase fatty acid binding subunit
MSSVCILTDSAVQFPNPSFTGRDFVQSITLPIELSGKIFDDFTEIRSIEFPEKYAAQNPCRILPPPPQKIDQVLKSINRDFKEIIILSVSSRLSGSFFHWEEAVQRFTGSSRIYLIDSQSISIGQGFLVEHAVEGLVAGKNAAEIERDLRKKIAHIFNLFCTTSLTYLQNSGIIDPPQAMVSDFYNLFPVFILEGSQFTPMLKVKNYRAALESFQEFLDEFEKLEHISALQGGAVHLQDIRVLKQFCDENFPNTTFSEHQMNPYLSAIFGPGFLGLFIEEYNS